jgi:hypothetical protein
MAFAAPLPAQSRRAARVRAPSASPPRFSSQDVPGLGFDYAHLAAVTPRTQALRAEPGPAPDQFITPIFWGWPAYFAPQSAAPQPAAPQPIVIILQQPPPTVIVIPAPGAINDAPRDQAAAPSAPSLSPAPPPLRERSPFALLRRDGQIILSSIFGVSGGILTYIDRNGARRSFPLAELDVEATQQMNEAAGRPITLPR